MSTFMEEYKQKLITPEKAAQLVKSGDVVHYGQFTLFPYEFDKALGKRAGDENLHDVTVELVSSVRFPEVVKNDPDMETFTCFNYHYSIIDRMMGDQGRIAYIPISYHCVQKMRKEAKQPWDVMNVICVSTTPMDGHGNFNFGLACSNIYAMMAKADIVIVEVNETVPYVMGGDMECINIKDVDYIIESHEPIVMLPPAPEPTAAEKKIAEIIMPLISDRCCLQLGIGGVPNAVGKMIAQSDLKDLGINTEMFCDAMVEMYEAGKITGKYKNRDVGRTTFAFALGGKMTNEFLHCNPQVAAYNCDYTNSPLNVAKEDNVVSINNLIEIDLLSQICSESNGLRQISGTGGALDFHMGAYESNNGKGILVFPSTYTDKEGKMHSRIKPMLTPGATVTVPRALVHYVATEYGVVNIKGRSVWGRAEAVISLAHPDFRDELIKSAKEMKLWSPTNKIPY